MTRILMILMVVGGFLAFKGCQEWRLADTASDKPQEIACAKLEADGPGDNAHIVLTDFLVCPQGYVYETSKKGSSWSCVWAPVVPLNGEYVNDLKKAVAANGGEIPEHLPMPKKIQVIVKSKKVRSEADFDRFTESKTMTGMIVNKIESMGREEKDILAQSYPGIDFNDCWLLEAGRTPTSSGGAFGMLAGGAGLIGVGLFAMMKRTQKA